MNRNKAANAASARDSGAPRSRADAKRPEGVHVTEPANAAVDRLTLRLDELAKALGISRRAVERMRSAGRLPRPDLIVGRMPLWRPETIREWIERGGRA